MRIKFPMIIVMAVLTVSVLVLRCYRLDGEEEENLIKKKMNTEF